MAELTNFNMVGLGVLTQVRVAGKDFSAGCASKVSVIVGVLAMFDWTCNGIKMPGAFITTINILPVLPGMVYQHTFTHKFSVTPGQGNIPPCVSASLTLLWSTLWYWCNSDLVLETLTNLLDVNTILDLWSYLKC